VRAMRYSGDASLDAVYGLIARLSEPNNPDEARLDEALIIAGALIELGEDRSWASVWWAYGALHYDLSDEALARALELLARVDHPDEARAAARMLEAEIKFTQAIYADSTPSHDEQRALLDEAVALAPDWPSLRLRLARACKAAGDEPAAREHAARLLVLLRGQPSPPNPFDSAITEKDFDRGYLEREIDALGLGDAV
jgi:tetratricopeptide (TPR) repeat protein